MIEPLEARLAPAAVVALTDNNRLLIFDSASPGVIQATTSITGMGSGEVFVSLEFNSGTGLLYGLALDSTAHGHIYQVNAGTGAASLVSELKSGPAENDPPVVLSGSRFSLEFSTQFDDVKTITSDSGMNLRVPVLATGQTITKSLPHYGAADSNVGSALVLAGAAYHASSPDWLVGIDTETDRVVTAFGSEKIDSGTFKTFGSLGFDASGYIGMDNEPGSTQMLLSMSVQGSTGLYVLNLSGTGLVTKVGSIGGGTTPIRDIAVVQNVWTGAGTNNLWSNAGNWASGLQPSAGNYITLKSSGGELETVNDLPEGTRILGLSMIGDNAVSGHSIAVVTGISTSGVSAVHLRVQLANSTQYAYFSAVDASSRLTLDGDLDMGQHAAFLSGNGTVEIIGDVLGGGIMEAGSANNVVSGTKTWMGPIQTFHGSLSLTGDHSYRQILAGTDAVLTGDMSIGSLSTVSGGTIAPGGDSVGVIAVRGEVKLSPLTVLKIQVDGTGAEPVADRLVAMQPSLAGTLAIDDKIDSKAGEQFMIVENTGSDPTASTFSGIAEHGIVSGTFHRYWMTYRGGDGNDVVLTQLPEVTLSADKRVATFTDSDGDLVKVAINKGSLSADQFVLIPLANRQTSELVRLDLGSMQAGANVTITASPQDINGDGRKDGDGFVNVGTIDASGVNLGNVSVDGNLGQLVAGAGGAGSGVKSLSVRSLGALDAFHWEMTEDHTSTIDGDLPKLSVKSDISGALLKISGNLGHAAVGGSILGGNAAETGKISVSGDLGSLSIRGNIEAGNGEYSGMVAVGGMLNELKISGSMYGGSATGSGSVAAGAIRSFQIAGDLRSGGGENSGALIAESDIRSAVIGGSLSANLVSHSGQLGKLSIAGAISGADEAHTLISAEKIGTVKITAGARFAEVSSNTIIAAISVGGTASDVEIYAAGVASPIGQKESVAIGKITVGGSLVDSRIGAGYQRSTSSFNNADASIGSVLIAGDYLRSDISAGFSPVDAWFGNGDDRLVGNGGNSTIVSRIASVVIKGQAYGSGRANEWFGVIAESIGSVKLGKIGLALTDLRDRFEVGAGGNLVFEEKGRSAL